MTDKNRNSSALTNTDLLGGIASEELTAESQKKVLSVGSDANRRERRRLIGAALASGPVLLTFTAGKSFAAGESVEASGASTDGLQAADDDGPTLEAEEEEGDGELTPAEKLETFGLQRAERPEGYEENPYRNLDTVHDEAE